MEIKAMLENAKERMQKSLHTCEEKLSSLRTGRASVLQFENIQVECYGSNSPLKQLANINSPEPRLIVIQAWDLSILGNIEKAVQKHTVSLNPQNDGKVLRISIPPLTDEARQQSIKQSKLYDEEAKIAIRNIRRDVIDKLKKMEHAHEIGEDELAKQEQEAQKLTDEHVKKVDELHKAKVAEITDV